MMNVMSLDRRKRSLLLVAGLLLTTIGFLITVRLKSLQSVRSSTQSSMRSSVQLSTDAYFYALDLPGTQNRRQFLQAEIDLAKAQVSRDPTSGLALASLASAYWNLGKASGEVSWYLLAEQQAQRSIDLLPFSNPSAKLTLAQIAQARHDFKQARSIAETVLKEKPKSEEAQRILVTGLLATGNLDVGSEHLTALLGQAPNLSNLTLQALMQEAKGDPKAVQTFRYAIEVEEAGEIGASALVRVLLGRHFYQRGDLTQAAGLYQEALRILPNYPPALLYLAMLETRRGNYEAADRAYKQVIAYSQQAVTVYDHVILRGRARVRQAQNLPADDLLQRAEASLRNQINAGHGAVNTVNSGGDFGHRRELAQLLLDRNAGTDATEAVQLMQQEVNLRQDAQTLAIFARALSAIDRPSEAQAEIKRAIALGTQNAAIFLQAAEIEQRLGNEVSAKDYTDRARQVDPSFDAAAQRSLGLDVL
jgi:tetratricopeptide (TPR) repeat protein